MNNALIPGSFDPITVGHLDIIKRASTLFSSVTVLVSKNSDKCYLLTDEQRKLLVTDAVKNIKNVTVDFFDGYVADYSYKNNIDVLVKGIRNNDDFDYEFKMALANQQISSERFSKQLETLLLPSNPQFDNISSTLVKEYIKSGKDINDLVPNKKLLFEFLGM